MFKKILNLPHMFVIFFSSGLVASENSSLKGWEDIQDLPKNFSYVFFEGACKERLKGELRQQNPSLKITKLNFFWTQEDAPQEPYADPLKVLVSKENKTLVESRTLYKKNDRTLAFINDRSKALEIKDNSSKNSKTHVQKGRQNEESSSFSTKVNVGLKPGNVGTFSAGLQGTEAYKSMSSSKGSEILETTKHNTQKIMIDPNSIYKERRFDKGIENIIEYTPVLRISGKVLVSYMPNKYAFLSPIVTEAFPIVDIFKIPGIDLPEGYSIEKEGLSHPYLKISCLLEEEKLNQVIEIIRTKDMPITPRVAKKIATNKPKKKRSASDGSEKISSPRRNNL